MSLASKKYFDQRAATQRPAHLLVVLLTIGVAALIAFGSLYPFDIDMPDTQSIWQSFWHATSQLSWARAGRSDRIANVLLYAPLGFCVFLNLDGRIRSTRAASIALMIGALLSYSIELSQVFIPSRVASYWDLVCNIGGTAAGIVGGIAWRILSVRLATESNTRDLTAILGLSAWFVWRWAPFDLHVGLSAFKAAVQPLSGSQSQLQFSHCLLYLVWWLVVAEQVFAWANRARATENLLIVIAATLAGRFFFVDAPLMPAELLALVMLLPILVMLHRLQGPPRHYLLATAFAIVYLWSALPFWHPTITTRNGFDWWPFMGWMKAGFRFDVAWLAHQLFMLIATAWLLRRAGMPSKATIYWITSSILALEFINVAAIGSGSLTLPAIAFVTTLVLHAIGGKGKRRY